MKRLYGRIVCAIAGHHWVRQPGGTKMCIRSGCIGRLRKVDEAWRP